MDKVYVTRCLVKKDGKSYTKGSVIKDLTSEEITQGLAEYWLEAVGNDEEPTEKKPDKPPKPSKNKKPEKPGQDDPLEKMTAGELIAEAVSLGLQTDSSMSEEAIRKMIREARQ
jgi:heme-binding NEAT domain protein